MYHAKVNNQYTFDINVKKEVITVNGSSVQIDIQELAKGRFHVLKDNRSYNAELIQLDKETKTAIIQVNNNPYRIELKDQFDALLKQLGMDSLNVKKLNEIKAPMPGLVLRILVEEGTVFKKGDNLLVLEAMKMENIIKATADGIVKAIKVNASDKVDKNQVLISLV